MVVVVWHDYKAVTHPHGEAAKQMVACYTQFVAIRLGLSRAWLQQASTCMCAA